MSRTVVTEDAGAFDAGGVPLSILEGSVTEAEITLADNLTNDVTTGRHGFAPKLPNDATKFLNGVGGYAVPPGTAAVSSVFGRTGAVVAATNDYSEAQLSFTDITTNDVSTTKHGFAPKAPSDATKFLDGTAAYDTVKDADLSTSDIVTNDVSTSKHGFAPKLPNDATKFLNGVGAYAVPAASSVVGGTVLVYRYTVTGSDKASIDTGVDTPQAGTNDWTNGDLLEIALYGRTDDTGSVFASIDVRLNNDSGGNYDRIFVQGLNATASAANSRAQTSFAINVASSSASASVFGMWSFRCPNYTGTSGFKILDSLGSVPDGAAAASMLQVAYSFAYRSTSALTRLSVAPQTALKKFKVGTQLLIYKRTSV